VGTDERAAPTISGARANKGILATRPEDPKPNEAKGTESMAGDDEHDANALLEIGLEQALSLKENAIESFHSYVADTNTEEGAQRPMHHAWKRRLYRRHRDALKAVEEWRVSLRPMNERSTMPTKVFCDVKCPLCLCVCVCCVQTNAFMMETFMPSSGDIRTIQAASAKGVTNQVHCNYYAQGKNITPTPAIALRLFSSGQDLVLSSVACGAGRLHNRPATRLA
jgi:hypothetical protein